MRGEVFVAALKHARLEHETLLSQLIVRDAFPVAIISFCTLHTAQKVFLNVVTSALQGCIWV